MWVAYIKFLCTRIRYYFDMLSVETMTFFMFTVIKIVSETNQILSDFVADCGNLIFDMNSAYDSATVFYLLWNALRLFSTRH